MPTVTRPALDIITGDCRAVLADHEASSFDACIADPPYADTSLKWDQIVHGWIPAVARVLKPNASIWVFGSMRHFASQRIFALMRRSGFRYSQDIVWEKQNGTGFHNDRYRRVHEHAVLFYRGDWRDVYHAPQFTATATAKTVRRKTRPTHTGHIERGHYVSEDGGPLLLTSVRYYANAHGQAIHPTQKPVGLLREMVRYSCPPGGRMLDPFGGSCSTGMATEAEDRPSTCIELNPETAARAREWVSGGALFSEVA